MVQKVVDKKAVFRGSALILTLGDVCPCIGRGCQVIDTGNFPESDHADRHAGTRLYILLYKRPVDKGCSNLAFAGDSPLNGGKHSKSRV